MYPTKCYFLLIDTRLPTHLPNARGFEHLQETTRHLSLPRSKRRWYVALLYQCCFDPRHMIAPRQRQRFHQDKIVVVSLIGYGRGGNLEGSEGYSYKLQCVCRERQTARACVAGAKRKKSTLF